MRYENTKKLFQYWQNLRGDRPAPERSEIEPSDIRTLLGDTFILEINHIQKIVSYRLAGTRLCAAHARELKGLGYLAHWDENDNLDIMRALAKTYAYFEPSLVSYLAETEQRRFVEFEALLLPLLPVDKNTSRILGIATPKKVPFWIGSEPIINYRLRSIRTPKIKESSGAELKLPPSLKQEEKRSNANFKFVESGRKVAHLMVLDGGKS